MLWGEVKEIIGGVEGNVDQGSVAGGRSIHVADFIGDVSLWLT